MESFSKLIVPLKSDFFLSFRSFCHEFKISVIEYAPIDEIQDLVNEANISSWKGEFTLALYKIRRSYEIFDITRTEEPRNREHPL